jgi:hypothetical protein
MLNSVISQRFLAERPLGCSELGILGSFSVTPSPISCIYYLNTIVGADDDSATGIRPVRNVSRVLW